MPDHPLIPHRPIFGSSRAPQITVNDDFQINEFSALVGTYRILLLRAHKRLYGPSGNEELRKLRALTEHVLAKIRDPDSDAATAPWTCALCDVTQANGHAAFPGQGEGTPSTRGQTANGHEGQTAGPNKRWLDATFSVEPTQRTNGVGRHGNRVSPVGVTNSNRSKFCVIL